MLQLMANVLLMPNAYTYSYVGTYIYKYATNEHKKYNE